MLIKDLEKLLADKLNSARIKDYCPNGLQVEGRAQCQKIVTGVTASLALIEKAAALGADTILVHHGYFWKGESEPIVGMKKNRISALLHNQINLLAYHLPIDVHPELGNNAQLGKLLQLSNIEPLLPLEPAGIVMVGELKEALSHREFNGYLENKLGRLVISVGSKGSIKRIAWCTGGGQNFIDQVDQANSDGANIDAFISGEISEQTTHSAREQNIDYFAVGHHASERYGVKALGEWLQAEHNIDVEFVDVHNPA